MRLAGTLRWVGLIGIVSIAILRCLVLFAPQVVFDTDPAVKDAMPLAGMGPAGSLLLDVLLLCAFACAMLGEWRSGRGVGFLICVLALIPIPVVLWHGAHDAGNLWRGVTWAAAMIACVAIAHLARDQFMRTVLIALLLATIGPLLARGAAQMTFEHSETVQAFEKTKEQFFRDKGWEPGSPAGRIFERRLRQPQPLGWFSTTNIFASMAGFSFIMFVGLAVSSARAKLQSGWAGAMALAAIAAAAALACTGAKGAVGAVILGLGLGLILDFGLGGWILDCDPRASLRPVESKIQNPPPQSKIRFSSGALIMLLLALTLLAVIARGLLLPEGFLHEKSLLFRWQYLVASARMFMDHALLGVGPDGFQEAYTLYRLPRNPEEVASAHSMFIDWICTLGIAGVAWVSVVLLLVRRVSANLNEPCLDESNLDGGHSHILKKVRTSSTPNQPPGQIAMADSVAVRKTFMAAMAVLLLAVVAAAFIEWPELTLDHMSVMVRALGGLGFVAVAALVAFIIENGDKRTTFIALIAAIAMLLVHGQIEMTFQQPGSVVWAMCVVGLIGGASTKHAGEIKNALAAMLTIAAILGVSVWLIITAIVPAFQQERAMVRAAESLWPIAQNPGDAGLMMKTRRAAAAALVDAYEIWPLDVHPLDAAARQLELAASQPAGPQPLGVLMDALDLANRAVREHDKSSSLVNVVGINARLAQLTGDAVYWNGATDAARRLTQRDPNSLNAWRRLGDVQWMSGNHAQAAASYDRALECDANFALDEFKQLPERDRKLLRERIEQVQTGKP